MTDESHGVAQAGMLSLLCEGGNGGSGALSALSKEHVVSSDKEAGPGRAFPVCQLQAVVMLLLTPCRDKETKAQGHTAHERG